MLAHTKMSRMPLGCGTIDWGGWIRTTDLLINSQALCQLSYTPSTTEAVTQFDETVAPTQRLGLLRPPDR